MMALTATATSRTRSLVINEGMPCHQSHTNKKFSVLKKPNDMMDVLYPILFDVVENGKNSERHLIFCR